MLWWSFGNHPELTRGGSLIAAQDEPAMGFENYGLTHTFRSTMELKENTIIVVLGASGDLAKKKTVST